MKEMIISYIPELLGYLQAHRRREAAQEDAVQALSRLRSRMDLEEGIYLVDDTVIQLESDDGQMRVRIIGYCPVIVRGPEEE